MKRLKSLALALPILLVVAVRAGAQSQPSQFIQVVAVTVRPGSVTEYEDYVKKIVAGAGKIGAPQRVIGYQVALGGAGFTYNFVIPFAKWGEMDSWVPIPQILSKAYGEVEGARLLKAGRNSIERSENAVFRLLPDLSTRPKAFDPPPAFVQLIRTEVEPSMGPEYELYLAKLRAAQEQEPNSPTAVRRVSVLGPAPTYVSATPFDKHAERDGWPQIRDLLRKTYGEGEGRHILESSLRFVRKRDFLVLAHRPDLSRATTGPAPSGN